MKARRPKIIVSSRPLDLRVLKIGAVPPENATVIDRKAHGGNKVTLPIGLGITKTIRIGRMPVKLRLEPQYSIIRPDDYGTEWNIRLQITPVLPVEIVICRHGSRVAMRC